MNRGGYKQPVDFAPVHECSPNRNRQFAKENSAPKISPIIENNTDTKLPWLLQQFCQGNCITKLTGPQAVLQKIEMFWTIKKSNLLAPPGDCCHDITQGIVSLPPLPLPSTLSILISLLTLHKFKKLGYCERKSLLLALCALISESEVECPSTLRCHKILLRVSWTISIKCANTYTWHNLEISSRNS